MLNFRNFKLQRILINFKCNAIHLVFNIKTQYWQFEKEEIIEEYFHLICLQKRKSDKKKYHTNLYFGMHFWWGFNVIRNLEKIKINVP